MSSKYKTITISMIRHAAVDGPSALYGSGTDISCSPKALEAINPLPSSARVFDEVIISPLARAHETFNKLFATVPFSGVATMPSPSFKEESAIREFNFGDYDGRPFSQYSLSDNDILERFNKDPINSPLPNAENILDFERRIRLFLYELAVNAPDKKQVLIITHGGVIAAIMGLILKTPLLDLLISMPPANIKKTVISIMIPEKSTIQSLETTNDFFGRILCFNVEPKTSLFQY